MQKKLNQFPQKTQPKSKRRLSAQVQYNSFRMLRNGESVEIQSACHNHFIHLSVFSECRDKGKLKNKKRSRDGIVSVHR